MKYSRILISTALMTAMIGLSGCYDDKGNYDYISEDELISVKIAELSDISVKANELLEVIPELKNNDSRRYDYCWYAMKENYPYNVDTLSYEQDLSIVCNLEVGKYTLYYMISDPVLDIYVNTSFALSVTATDINTGWYIFKEEGDYSDIDYISLANESKNNLFKNILNIDPPYGKPVGLDYVPNNYNHEKENADGTVTLLQSQSVIHVVTEHDFISLNANDMSVFKTLDDQFYEKPAEIEFQNVNSDMYGSQVIIANNNLHTVGSAIGKLGYQLPGGYDVHPDVLMINMGCFFCDNKTNKLFQTWYSAENTYEVTPLAGEFTEFEDKDVEMIRILPQIEKSFSSNAYGFFRSRTEQKYYLCDFNFFASYYWPVPTLIELDDNDDLINASIMTIPTRGSVIFFADDNKLKVHKIFLGEEELLKTFPSDEKISYIKNIEGDDSDGNYFNDLFVATYNSTEYKIYRFPMIGSSGEISVSSDCEWKGTGKVGNMMFRQY